MQGGVRAGSELFQSADKASWSHHESVINALLRFDFLPAGVLYLPHLRDGVRPLDYFGRGVTYPF